MKAKTQIQSQYVDFTELGRGEQEITANEEVAPDQSSVSKVAGFEGTFVCVKHDYRQLRTHLSPFYLARLEEKLYATEKAKAKVTYFAQDLLLPFQFVEAIGTATGELAW